MKGLYKGKYLIAAYDMDDLPVFVASTSREFLEFCLKRYKGISCSTSYKCLQRALENGGSYYLQELKIYLIEADKTTHDCFEDADEDFKNFIKANETKKYYKIASEMDLSISYFYRLRKAGFIKVNKYE